MSLTIRERVRGAVLGAAIGDAMGHPTEFLSAEAVRRKYPPDGVTGFELWWERGGKRFAPYTDDTQMAEIVLRALVDSKTNAWSLDETMRKMAHGFVLWRIDPQGGHRSPGNSCMMGAARLSIGVHWSEAGEETAGGCGSVMRAYPFGLLFASDPAAAVEWSVAHSALTHRDPIALAACAAMAVGAVLMLNDTPLDAVFEVMIEAAAVESQPTADLMRSALASARDGSDPLAVLTELAGWAADEAIAAAVFVVARHPDDVRAAILEGANADGDSDSIATLVGALLGARIGIAALPSDWVRDVERSDELLALADQAASLMEG